MKKITFFIFLMATSLGYSQTNPIDFEAAGNGASWTWNTFENPSTPCPPLLIIPNPDASGANTSATVAGYTPVVGAPFYAGTETAHGSPLGTFNLTAANCIVKILVWKPVISNVGIKFATPSGASTGEINVANTLVNQWEELTFDFSSKIGQPESTGIDQIIVFIDSQNGRTTDNTCYFDNIRFLPQTVSADQPTVAAPTPTVPAANVISMFSNAYSNVNVDTWRTVWSAADLTDLQIAGNDTKKYSNLDFVGIETTGANLIDASAMNFFHVDVWTPNITTFRVKLVDFGADAAFGGGDDTEQELSFTPTLSGWNSFEIPMADFTGLINRNHIAQLIFAGSPAGSSTAFIDNVYFHNAPIVNPDEPTVAAPTPTVPAANVISMFSNAYTNVNVDTWRTVWSAATLTDLQIAGNDTKKYSNLDFVGIETTGANLIDASAMNFFHVDVWTPNITTFRVKLVDFGADAAFGGGDDTEQELSFTPTLSGWNSFEIPMADFTGLINRNHIAQLIFAGSPAGSSTAFIDNVYFHNAPIVNPDEPTVAAPTPTIPSANVISMFSNAYTNVNVDTWRTVWSAATLTDLQIAGNDTKKYSNLDFVGIETTGANLIDASAMNFFHVDVWTPNITTFRVKLVDFGADAAFGGGDDTEQELSFTPTLSGWNSFEIPMADFTGLINRNHIAQLIFAGSPAGSSTAFIDNVYFSTTSLALNNFDITTATVYPNPTENLLHLTAQKTIENVSVYNLLGQEVLVAKPLVSDSDVDLSTLQSGQYLVKVTVAGATTTTKVIKK
ncbi:T9SS type A sorting domain-containing protein [Flavobacterium sp. CYK-4]|uniref:T9SS type A sorting domain-containing protein n=1 Tax=Flavobacterium lotistagni TaxID=2709660 RepID=UPI0014092A0D|nr:T9SS type A sorting domain-containing protein [Flavobacterium lotistagni]NHM06810.1 T9SS type A sorting domain-containing protein [Flavobacterium lotistagni]